MTNPAWNGQEVAFLKFDCTILKLDPQGTPYDVEQLVLAVMRMPNQFALELRP